MVQVGKATGGQSGPPGHHGPLPNAIFARSCLDPPVRSYGLSLPCALRAVTSVRLRDPTIGGSYFHSTEREIERPPGKAPPNPLILQRLTQRLSPVVRYHLVQDAIWLARILNRRDVRIR